MIEINLIRRREIPKNVFTRRWITASISALFCLICLISYLSLSKRLANVPALQELPHSHREKKKQLSTIAENIPLEQLHWVGYLEFENHFLGFLQLPTGEIREIKTGTMIGKENALILHLNKKQMVIQVNEMEIIKNYLL